MSDVHTSADAAGRLYTEVFTTVLRDPEFTGRLRDRGLSLLFVFTDPTVSVLVSADGVHVDEVPFPPALRFELDTGTAEAIWQGALTIPRAIAERRVTVKGHTLLLRQLGDVLPAIAVAYSHARASAAPAAVG